MAETAAKKIAVSMKLNNGVDSGGNVKTVSISLGSLNVTRYDADKALAVINLITPCLAKTIEDIEQTTTSILMSA